MTTSVPTEEFTAVLNLPASPNTVLALFTSAAGVSRWWGPTEGDGAVGGTVVTSFGEHGVNAMRSPDCALVVITHHQRLLDYLVPDYTHVLLGGRIVKSGGRELAFELEKRGYRWIEDELKAHGSQPAARQAS